MQERPTATPAATRILQYCARPQLGAAADLLQQPCQQDLHGLADLANHERMSGLAYRHLAPYLQHTDTLRRLAAYRLRTVSHNQTIQTALKDTLTILGDEPVLLLKGAALNQFLYRDPGDRYMGDIDLMVHPDRIDQARKKLVDAGYYDHPEDWEIAHDNHVKPVYWEGKVSIELHRSFFGGGSAGHWEALLPRAVPTPLAANALRPATTDMIWQAWYHVFRGSLRWIPWYLLGVADLVGLLHCADVDWDRASDWVGLSYLHQLTPLDASVLSRFRYCPPPARAAGDHYQGWPRNGATAATTCMPTEWWLQMRHGIYGRPLVQCYLDHWRDLYVEKVRPWTGPVDLR